MRHCLDINLDFFSLHVKAKKSQITFKLQYMKDYIYIW